MTAFFHNLKEEVLKLVAAFEGDIKKLETDIHNLIDHKAAGHVVIAPAEAAATPVAVTVEATAPATAETAPNAPIA
jgi:hypothetical protein